MNQPKDGHRKTADLQHYGRVLAGLSHELNNTLGTVQQSAGLLEDYLGAMQQGRVVDPSRLEKVAQRIRSASERSLGSINFLHWFAHSIDVPKSTVDLASIAERVISVSDYFARKKQVSIELCLDEPPQTLLASAFDIHQLLFRAVEFTLESAAEATKITIKIASRDEATEVEIRCAESVGSTPQAGALRSLIEELGATMTELDGGGVVLHLPRELHNRHQTGSPE